MLLRRLFSCLTLFAILAAACSSDGSDDPEPEAIAEEESAPDEPEPEPEEEPAAEPEDAAVEEETVEAEADQVTYVATITRTTNNVPHIVADSMESVAFGYGFAFAEDHACSLADVVVRARSELASFHGPGPGDEYLNSDLVLKAAGVYDTAQEEFAALDPETQDIIAGYADGYNQYVLDTGVDEIPGWCVGAEWVRPISAGDLMAYYKVLGLRASLTPLTGFITSATPPSVAVPGTATDGDSEDEEAFAAFDSAVADVVPDDSQLGSNAWAIGPDRTVGGTTMIVGNPHFPWQGALRFYEVHLTVPGELNVYGASLLGSPAVNIGFNDDVAWSHTVSNGHRFTAYTLDLVEGDPTSYIYGDEERQMEPRPVSVDVLGEDGSIETIEQTIWFSHYGPILNFPGIGWSEQQTLTIRDANADNDELIPQFLGMNQATSMDEFIGVHEEFTGIPWVNTVAASADGRIWYADTASTPNLSDEAIDAWKSNLETDAFTSIGFDNGVILLDGSDPLFEWVDDPDARDSGVVPFKDMPQLERSDYLFNANDAYYWTHPDEPIGPFSPLHGDLGAPSQRTRMNAIMLGIENGGAGEDGLFTHDELSIAAVENRVLTAELLVDDVLERCDVSTTAVVNDQDVDLEKACNTLSDWDRHANLDSRGAVLWREFMNQYGQDQLRDGSDLWANRHDPDSWLETPNGLPFTDGGTDLALEKLAGAVLVLEAAGHPVDVALGEVQFAYRGDVEVPIHGGLGPIGLTNVVAPGNNTTTTEPNIDGGEPVDPGGRIQTDGYPIANGTSFIYALEFTADGPVANAFLTYGNTGDSTSEFFSDQTQAFSNKAWRPVAFTDEAIEAEMLNSYEVVGG